MKLQEYDIIGDIHGYADELCALLEKLDYNFIDGCYRHKTKKVIFLGDFIDRGPKQRETLQTVIPMVQQGSALAVMGNHEFNALAFHTELTEQPNSWLRPHNNKNTQQHIRFLDEYISRKIELKSVLDFFYTLPLWLDLDGIRVVHACWEPKHIEYLRTEGVLTPNGLMTPDFLKKASVEGSNEYTAIEALLKGVEMKLPDGKSFKDKDGNERTEVRVQWWKNEDCTFKEIAFPPGILDERTEKIQVPKSELVNYQPQEKPVFLGHYWLNGETRLLAPNVACVDYSVAKGGKLVAYRWEGEQTLDDEKFAFV